MLQSAPCAPFKRFRHCLPILGDSQKFLSFQARFDTSVRLDIAVGYRPIEAAGKRIYIDSGGVPGAPPSAAIGHVDLAILGVALPDSRQRFAEAVRRLSPRYILPSHQDDLLAPLSGGFVFGKLTNFPQLLRTQKAFETRDG